MKTLAFKAALFVLNRVYKWLVKVEAKRRSNEALDNVREHVGQARDKLQEYQRTK